MILDKITQTNFDFLFEVIKDKFLKDDNYNDLEPKDHLYELMNKISVYFHFSDLSYLDVFYLKRFFNLNFKISHDFKNSKNTEMNIAQFDMYSAFNGIDSKKKFKTIIHLTGSKLISLFNGRPYEFYCKFFSEEKIDNPFDFPEDKLLNYIFKNFLNSYYKFINQFISETDLLVDAKIYSTFYKNLDPYSTDVIFDYIDSANGRLLKSDLSDPKKVSLFNKHDLEENSDFIFSVNSSLVSFMLLYNNFLNPGNLLDFKDFKLVAKSDILSWMNTLLSSDPNRSKTYSFLNDINKQYKSCLKNLDTALTRYSYLIGGAPISYTLKLRVEEILELKSKVAFLDLTPIENSELSIIIDQIFNQLLEFRKDS